VVESKTHRPEWGSHQKGGSEVLVASILARGEVLQRLAWRRGLWGGVPFLCFQEEANGGGSSVCGGEKESNGGGNGGLNCRALDAA
jgi:hypothetical protein